MGGWVGVDHPFGLAVSPRDIIDPHEDQVAERENHVLQRASLKQRNQEGAIAMHEFPEKKHELLRRWADRAL